MITRHDPLGEFSPAHREIMVQRTDQELAHRSRTAAFSHFAIAGVVYVATPYRVDHPRIIAALLVTTFVLGLWRLTLNLGFFRLYALSPRAEAAAAGGLLALESAARAAAAPPLGNRRNDLRPQAG